MRVDFILYGEEGCVTVACVRIFLGRFGCNFNSEAR